MTPADVTVYLVRHGRTALNAAGVLRGRLDPPLDHVGLQEAAALGRVFQQVTVAVVFSSPLIRARQTAAAIADATDAEVTLVEDLADRDYGDWTGRTLDDLEAAHGSVDDAPGVEPLRPFTERVTTTLIGLVSGAGTDPVVVVAHDAVIRTGLAVLVPALGSPDEVPQRTGCWNRLDRRRGTWTAAVINAVPEDGRRP